MRAPADVRLERLEKLIQRISHESEEGGVIVVEGQQDRESLRTMGIKGKILCLQSSRKNAVSFVEELEGEGRVIVLTDFDRQGVFLAKRLARLLASQRRHTNLVLWSELRGLTRSDVRSIEELPKFHHRLQTEVFFGAWRPNRKHARHFPTKRSEPQHQFRKRGHSRSA